MQLHQHVDTPAKEVEILGHEIEKREWFHAARDLDHVEVRIETQLIGHEVEGLRPPPAVRARNHHGSRGFGNPWELTSVFRHREFGLTAETAEFAEKP